MTYYFWLGDYQPYAEEEPEAEWATTEDDGWITVHPDLNN